MTLRQHSYGIIPLYKGEQGIEVLLAKQTQQGRTYWSFAKGTPEAGESPIETARRETEEEVGITFGEIDESKAFSEHYSFVRDGEQIEKTTTYYLGFAESREFKIQEEEIDEAMWLPLDQVEEKLTYSETKKLFIEFNEYLGTI